MNKKILLIEDDLDLIENIREFLQEEGFLFSVVNDGKAGISRAQEWLPDLILCDINIPLKDGYEVLSALSKEKTTKAIPFIFLTAKIEREDLRKGMQLGADDYIFKPFDIEDLLNSIKLRLGKSALRRMENLDMFPINKVYGLDDKILITTGGKMQFEVIKDLKYIRTENPYTRLKFTSGKFTLKRETLECWEAKLPEKTFIRIHRATIINTDFITKIEKLANSSYLIRLKDETEPFIISRRYSSQIKDRFS
jgi:DNA-binding LytR/AlgR family response regulator